VTLLAGASEGGPADADTPLVTVNDNPAAHKIGMVLRRCEAAFTCDISILPDTFEPTVDRWWPYLGTKRGVACCCIAVRHGSEASGLSGHSITRILVDAAAQIEPPVF
jgi:hypothetical protein